MALPKLGGHLIVFGRRYNGIAFHYHNHDYEFDDLGGGTTAMDLLLDGLDNDAVDLCLDVGWVYVAGEDPGAFLAAHSARTGYLHSKTTSAPQARPGARASPGASWATAMSIGMRSWNSCRGSKGSSGPWWSRTAATASRARAYRSAAISCDRDTIIERSER